jgi:hypothetical protein
VPASPQRRTRRTAPVEDVTPADELGEALGVFNPVPARRRSASQARRLQAATADPKVRLPEGERAAEAADGTLSVELAGKSFRLSDSIGVMPLMEWAASREEADPQDAGQLLSIYRILQDLVDPEDWLAFKQHAREAKCGFTEVFAFQNAAMEALTARPTGEPASS